MNRSFEYRYSIQRNAKVSSESSFFVLEIENFERNHLFCTGSSFVFVGMDSSKQELE